MASRGTREDTRENERAPHVAAESETSRAACADAPAREPRGFRRRDVLRAIAGTAALPAFWSLAPAACARPLRAYLPWDGPAPGGTEPRMRALGYAILAASPHNSQPWLVDLREPGRLALFVDRTRLLGATDPFQRQTYVGHGTFLEQLCLGAGLDGQRAEVTLLPRGEGPEDPVAAIAFAPGAQDHPLAQAIVRRQTSKCPFEDADVDTVKLDRIVSEAARVPEVDVFAVTDARRLAALTEICRNAMAIEVSSRDRNRELSSWFRLSSDEIEAHADGISLRQSGMNPVFRYAAEHWIVSHDSIEDPESRFSREAVSLTQELAQSARAWIVVSTRENGRRQQVLAGRAHARLQLAATLEGLATQPMSQAIQEYPAMAPLFDAVHALFDHPGTIQMLVRVGHAPRVEPTPRRSVRDLVLQSAEASWRAPS